MTTTKSSNLTVKAQGDREIVITRSFAAPKQLVYEALTKPELLRQWLGVRGGWTLDVCEVDPRPGGKYRYVWKNAEKGMSMGMGGAIQEIVPGEKLVATEKFDDAWYEGEGHVTTTLVEKNGVTHYAVTLRYESKAARDGVLKSPMESGLADSYNLLDALLTRGR